MPSVIVPILREPLILRAKGLVGWFRLAPLLAKLANATITVSTDGLDIQAINGGVHIKAPAATTADHPWKGTFASSTSVSIADGAVNGDVVPGATVSVPATGIYYVYLHIECSFTVSYNFVNAFTIDAITIVSASSVPSDNNVTGDYYITILSTTNGEISQQLFSAIGFRARGDNLQTSSAVGEYWT